MIEFINKLFEDIYYGRGDDDHDYIISSVNTFEYYDEPIRVCYAFAIMDKPYDPNNIDELLGKMYGGIKLFVTLGGELGLSYDLHCSDLDEYFAEFYAGENKCDCACLADLFHHIKNHGHLALISG